MKVKELIRQLQEADPSGELECCVDNIDIHFVSRWPANYDGSFEVLVRDPNITGFNITGGIIQCEGEKVQIRTLSLEDCLSEFDLNFPIDVNCNDSNGRKQADQRIKRLRGKVENELEEYRREKRKLTA
jgi:hypothetical protein